MRSWGVVSRDVRQCYLSILQSSLEFPYPPFVLVLKKPAVFAGEFSLRICSIHSNKLPQLCPHFLCPHSFVLITLSQPLHLSRTNDFAFLSHVVKLEGVLAKQSRWYIAQVPRVFITIHRRTMLYWYSTHATLLNANESLHKLPAHLDKDRCSFCW